jgi:predicted small lipoprotein YifL
MKMVQFGRMLFSALLSIAGCGGGGGVESPSANAAPVITSQPASQSVTNGQTATFTVIASGTAPLSYQWKKNSSNVGTKAASYTTPITTMLDNGAKFSVVVANNVSSAISNDATLTVNAVAAPPGFGVSAVAYQLYQTTSSPLVTSPIATQLSGSTIVASVGRGNISGFGTLPSDNKGNAPYLQLGSSHTYTLWPSSGTALYAFPRAIGGSGHTFTAQNSGLDETTVAVVEVMNGGVVQDFKWNEVLRGNPITSLSVTTTGPSTLIAFWWGDGTTGPHTAIPLDGFQALGGVLDAGNLVQCAVAAKNVTAAGTYNITWTSPGQGAQLWLVAVQKQP